MAIQSIFAKSKEKTITSRFRVDLVQHIDLVSDNAGIEFISTNNPEIIVEFSAPERKHTRYTFAANVNNGVLSIESKEKRRVSFFRLEFNVSNPKIKVYLPEKQYESVTMNVVNGKISTLNLTIEDLEIETINGAVTLSNMNTKISRIQSQNGKLSFRQLTGDIRGSVTNGSINLETDYLDRSINLSSVNGRISIHSRNQPSNVTIDVDVVLGKVEVFGKDTNRAVFGDGENKVNISTVNGSVKVIN
ncbi:DUF4097 family beta strand repeat-containing protein [Ornithinibacillus halophilus]|uniref:Putative adhesin n=1 Tax=Ornithinibacillus halophilus TaxID=930117 RepID=A0A1M5DZ96_9BACI|nr:DUF4097 family beta strand repeat-containing protein [Ornithinibacillus halophilus]SHF72132.1 Putative adhesin [Ornithinibacillus halophilus]